MLITNQSIFYALHKLLYYTKRINNWKINNWQCQNKQPTKCHIYLTHRNNNKLYTSPFITVVEFIREENWNYIPLYNLYSGNSITGTPNNQITESFFSNPPWASTDTFSCHDNSKILWLKLFHFVTIMEFIRKRDWAEIKKTIHSKAINTSRKRQKDT